jgi:hypothetical protein
MPVGSSENDLHSMSVFGLGVSRLLSVIEGFCLLPAVPDHSIE